MYNQWNIYHFIEQNWWKVNLNRWISTQNHKKRSFFMFQRRIQKSIGANAIVRWWFSNLSPLPWQYRLHSISNVLFRCVATFALSAIGFRAYKDPHFDALHWKSVLDFKSRLRGKRHLNFKSKSIATINIQMSPNSLISISPNTLFMEWSRRVSLEC